MPTPPSDPLLEVAPLAGELTSSSLVAYRRDVTLYRTFCHQQGLTPLQVTSFQRWRHYLVIRTRLSPHTVNRRLAAVRRIVQAAALQRQVPVPVARAFAQVRGVKVCSLKHRLKPTTRTRITPDQMREICEAPDPTTLLGLRDRALLAAMASSGARLSELLALTPAQVHRRGDAVFVEVCGKADTTPRLAPLSLEATAHLETWLQKRPVESAYCFTSFAGRGQRPTGRPLHLSGAWRMVQRYATRIGLQHVKPHDFRRFVGTEITKRDIRQAQKVLGHKDISTTALHYVLDDLVGGLTDHLY
jgi:integrase/recombinase XerD